MSPGETFPFDEIERFGDPWHGLVKDGVLKLPNGGTRALSGTAPVGGDCFAVRRAAPPAVSTPAADAAEGMTWLDYGLMCGTQHVLYGTALGVLSWVYVAPDDSAWRVQYANGPGTLSFTRFGLLGEAPAPAAQTIGLSGVNTSYDTRCLDLTPTGDKALIGSFIDSIYRQASRAAANILKGVYLIEIGGTPPAATATFTTLANEAACRGVDTNTRMTTVYESLIFAAPHPVNGFPYADPTTFEVVEWSYTMPTGGDKLTYNPGPPIPAGKHILVESNSPFRLSTVGWYPTITTTAPRVAYGSGGVVLIAAPEMRDEFDGVKSKTGVVIGAVCVGGVSPGLVTVDMFLQDSGQTNALARSGYLRIKAGGTVLEDLPFSSIYDVAENQFFLNLGDINMQQSVLNPDGSLQSGISISAYGFTIDFEFNETHLVMYGPGTPEPLTGLNSSGEPTQIFGYTSPKGNRFIPVRYANGVYGFLYVRGAAWALGTATTAWNETTQLVEQNHYARAVAGGVRKELTVPARGTNGNNTEAFQRLGFATAHPVTGTLEIHTSEICFK